MKYPLDEYAMKEICQDILSHSLAQQDIIARLSTIASHLLDEVENIDDEERQEIEKLLKTIANIKTEFENHRFNQKNGHNVGQRSPFPAESHERIAHIDLEKEAELNLMEAENFGDEMSSEEIANLLDSEKPKKKKNKQKKLDKMSLEEIETWEKAQENSNDIYKVSARIKNLARGAVKGNLTAQGDMVVNMFTHVIKSFYDFAETITDKETKIKLINLVKIQEEMPANLIAALGAGVKLK